MFQKLAVVIICATALPVCTRAQTSPPQPADTQEMSLADIARESKAKAKSAKVVVDEDSNFKRKSSVIPDITGSGLENSEAVLAAITQYRNTHTAKESEELLRSWWEENDGRIGRAWEENNRIDHPIELPMRTQSEYRLVYEQRMRDAETKRQNQVLISRIQSAFIKVRQSLNKDQVRWDWFKIRCGVEYCPEEVRFGSR